jgi:hypothetical protein
MVLKENVFGIFRNRRNRLKITLRALVIAQELLPLMLANRKRVLMAL